MKTINNISLENTRISLSQKNKNKLKLPEISVVIPCLNEADTLEICIRKIEKSFEENNIKGEIIIADNGSTDDSVEIAESFNDVRIVHVLEKGYGSALMGGIAAARGRYILMGDADDSYDFAEIPKYLNKLNEDYDLVMGCRLPKGGGRVMPNAMPFLHRWWGNPMFSYMARLWFNSPLNDVHCGMRGFRKDFYQEINQQCTGMEFATEMTIKASLYRYKIAEIPITLHKDGRKSHAPHLKTFRDGWRHLRLYVMYTPRWLFLLPGSVLIVLGMLAYVLGMFGIAFENPVSTGNINFGVHTVLFGSLFLMCGYQSILFAIFTKTFAISEGLLPEDKRMNRFFEVVNLEKILISAIGLLLFSIFLLLTAVYQWFSVSFGDLDASETLRLVVPGATLATVSFQTMLSGFFVSILRMKLK